MGNNTRLIKQLAHELEHRELDIFNKEQELSLKEADIDEREKLFEKEIQKLGLMEELKKTNIEILHKALEKEEEINEKEQILSKKEKGINEALEIIGKD